jgi:hypothetical protein
MCFSHSVPSPSINALNFFCYNQPAFCRRGHSSKYALDVRRLKPGFEAHARDEDHIIDIGDGDGDGDNDDGGGGDDSGGGGNGGGDGGDLDAYADSDTAVASALPLWVIRDVSLRLRKGGVFNIYDSHHGNNNHNSSSNNNSNDAASFGVCRVWIDPSFRHICWAPIGGEPLHTGNSKHATSGGKHVNSSSTPSGSGSGSGGGSVALTSVLCRLTGCETPALQAAATAMAADANGSGSGGGNAAAAAFSERCLSVIYASSTGGGGGGGGGGERSLDVAVADGSDRAEWVALIDFVVTHCRTHFRIFNDGSAAADAIARGVSPTQLKQITLAAAAAAGAATPLERLYTEDFQSR